MNAWLQVWAVTMADQRVHETTHERPMERFVWETLTPWVRASVPLRTGMPAARPGRCARGIAAARYSIPVKYVGKSIHVQETNHHYEIFHGGACIARHTKTTHAVVVDWAHYRGLLRPGGAAAPPRPPQWEPWAPHC